MLKKCFVCGKGAVAGRSSTHKGLLKKKGGTGRKTTRTTKRVFKPNLRKVSMRLGTTNKKVYVCAKCLKAGKVKKRI